MRKGFFVLLLMLVFSISHAEIYKWTDSQGNVHFSDKPHAGAEEVDLPQVQTYSSPQPATIPNKADGKEEADDEVTYSQLEITKPANKETLRNNDSTVPISVQIKPKLKKGDSLQLLYDDKPMGKPQTVTSFTISGIYRGSHTVAIQLLGSDGKVIKTSNTVTFYMMPPRVGMVPQTKPKK